MCVAVSSPSHPNAIRIWHEFVEDRRLARWVLRTEPTCSSRNRTASRIVGAMMSNQLVTPLTRGQRHLRYRPRHADNKTPSPPPQAGQKFSWPLDPVLHLQYTAQTFTITNYSTCVQHWISPASTSPNSLPGPCPNAGASRIMPPRDLIPLARSSSAKVAESFR